MNNENSFKLPRHPLFSNGLVKILLQTYWQRLIRTRKSIAFSRLSKWTWQTFMLLKQSNSWDVEEELAVCHNIIGKEHSTIIYKFLFINVILTKCLDTPFCV